MDREPGVTLTQPPVSLKRKAYGEAGHEESVDYQKQGEIRSHTSRGSAYREGSTQDSSDERWENWSGVTDSLASKENAPSLPTAYHQHHLQGKGPLRASRPPVSTRSEHSEQVASNTEAEEDPRIFPRISDFLLDLDAKAQDVGDWSGYSAMIDVLEEDLGIQRIHQLVEAAGSGKETTGAFLCTLSSSFKLGPANALMKAANHRVKAIRKGKAKRL